MLDPQIIRDNPNKVKSIITKGRGDKKKADIDKWLELDKQRSLLIQDRDELRRKRNNYSKNITGKPDQETIEKVKEIKEEIESKENQLQEVERQWQNILDWTPNLPISEEAMPFGSQEKDNKVIKAWTPQTGFIASHKLGQAEPQVDYMPERSMHWDKDLKNPKHHIDIATQLGLIDIEQSAIVSGSRFSYLIGDLVLLQYALQQHVYSELIKRGFIPMVPPLLVKDKVLYGTSHFPEGRDQVYQIKGDFVEEDQELNLVGSSEPTNFAYFMDRVIPQSSLPCKIFAYTPCFRSEVGSWGKDVRGIKRVHQFDKIEMDVVCSTEQSENVFNELLEINEWLWQSLQIPYRIVLKCTADAGYHASSHQIDPEGWLPGQKEFIELGTDTNTTDYQARRLNIKYIDQDGNKKYAHTVNDTAIAMGRALIAIIDNYQQSDGQIMIPQVLRPLMGGQAKLKSTSIF